MHANSGVKQVSNLIYDQINHLNFYLGLSAYDYLRAETFNHSAYTMTHQTFNEFYVFLFHVLLTQRT